MKSNLRNRGSVVAMMSLLILILPILVEAQDQCDPLTIAISGYNPGKEGGVLKLADDCHQARGENVLPIRLNTGVNVVTLALDEIRRRLIKIEPKVRRILEKKRKIIKDAIKAVVSACPNRKIHIICHSWGCTLAVRVAQDLAKRKQPINIDTMIMIDPITLLYPTDIAPKQDDQGRPIVPANVKTIFIVRQTWDGRGHLVGDRDVVIDNRQETDVVKNLHLRSKNPSEEERELLMAVLEDFRQNNPRNLRRGELHNFLDDSLVIRELALSSVNHPCAEPPTQPPPPPTHCSGPLSGDWAVLTTTASTFMCTQVGCGKVGTVCSCDTTNPNTPIIAGSLIALGPLGVCHEGNTLSGEWHPRPQDTVTLHGTVEPRGRPGILDDHVSFVHETRFVLDDCGQANSSVIGDGTVTDDSGLPGPTIEGSWQRTDKLFVLCNECPPPGNVLLGCVSNGTSFEIFIPTPIFTPSMEQSSSTDLNVGSWREKLTQDYKRLGLDVKCTLKSKTSALDSASVSH